MNDVPTAIHKFDHKKELMMKRKAKVITFKQLAKTRQEVTWLSPICFLYTGGPLTMSNVMCVGGKQ